MEGMSNKQLIALLEMLKREIQKSETIEQAVDEVEKVIEDLK